MLGVISVAKKKHSEQMMKVHMQQTGFQKTEIVEKQREIFF